MYKIAQDYTKSQSIKKHSNGFQQAIFIFSVLDWNYLRLTQGVFSNANSIYLFLMIFSWLSLQFKLFLVQYRGYKYGQFLIIQLNINKSKQNIHPTSPSPSSHHLLYQACQLVLEFYASFEYFQNRYLFGEYPWNTNCCFFILEYRYKIPTHTIAYNKQTGSMFSCIIPLEKVKQSQVKQ